MSKKDMFGDVISLHNDNDFASMFESNSDSVGGKLFVGQKFIGEILSMGKAESFVSTPSTQDAMILNVDLLDTDLQVKSPFSLQQAFSPSPEVW